MKARGFSLLEVVVALAVLGLSLMAIFDLNSGAVASHVYVKKLTVASLLARSKMTDLEQELYDQGFSNDDDEESGDFSEEGWPSFKWRAKIIAPKTQGLSPQQLIGALFNLPLGGEGGDDEGGLGALAALFGGQTPSTNDPNAAAMNAASMAALGPAQGLIQGQFTQMVDVLTKSVREVHLTVSWKEGKHTESIDLVTHVVSMGPGSDRNGSAGSSGGQSAPGAEQMVNARTGVPVPNPQPGPNGQMVDPADGQTPVIPMSEFLEQRAAQAGTGAVPPAGAAGVQPGQLPRPPVNSFPGPGGVFRPPNPFRPGGGFAPGGRTP